MASLRSGKRTWWITQQQGAEAPLFRDLAQRWRPVDRRERRLTPFALALSSSPAVLLKAAKTKRVPSRIALVAEQMKKSARTWNAWLNVK